MLQVMPALASLMVGNVVVPPGHVLLRKQVPVRCSCKSKSLSTLGSAVAPYSGPDNTAAPGSGGETEFASTRVAFNALTPAEQHELDRLLCGPAASFFCRRSQKEKQAIALRCP